MLHPGPACYRFLRAVVLITMYPLRGNPGKPRYTDTDKMTAGTIRDSVHTMFKPSFFFWVAVVMAVFVFGGFGMTYWKPLLTGNLYPLPPVVHVHGFFFSA